MNEIPWILTSHERLMLRLGQAVYPDAVTRATALALGMLATPADLDGITATVGADVATINLTSNIDRCSPITLGETLAALRTLADMSVLHETTNGLLLIDGRSLCSRFDPAMDRIGLDPGTQTESPTYRIDEQEAA
jgi:hypothetical protein